MKKTSLYKGITALLILAQCIVSIMPANAAGAYGNSLVNLRSAYWLIDKHPADWKKAPAETAAKNLLVGAIGEIKELGGDDGKTMKEHPLDIERIVDGNGRMLKAKELIKNTQALLVKSIETEPKKKSIKASAINHLTEIIKNIDKLIAGEK